MTSERKGRKGERKEGGKVLTAEGKQILKERREVRKEGREEGR